jgi:hypothetical protein
LLTMSWCNRRTGQPATPEHRRQPCCTAGVNRTAQRDCVSVQFTWVNTCRNKLQEPAEAGPASRATLSKVPLPACIRRRIAQAAVWQGHGPRPTGASTGFQKLQAWWEMLGDA